MKRIISFMQKGGKTHIEGGKARIRPAHILLGAALIGTLGMSAPKQADAAGMGPGFGAAVAHGWQSRCYDQLGLKRGDNLTTEQKAAFDACYDAIREKEGISDEAALKIILPLSALVLAGAGFIAWQERKNKGNNPPPPKA